MSAAGRETDAGAPPPARPPALRAVQGVEAGIVWIGRAAGLLIPALMAVIVFDVATRGAAWTNSTKLQELEWHLHTALVFLELGYALVRNRHVRIEIFRERWGPRLQAGVDAAGITLLLLPICAVAIWYSIDFVGNAYATAESSPSMTGLGRRWIVKATQPIGLGLVLLAGLCALARCAAALRRRG